jgi:hypothetical protein
MSFLEKSIGWAKNTTDDVLTILAYPFVVDNSTVSLIIVSLQLLVFSTYIFSYIKSAWYFREEYKFRYNIQ